MLNWTRPRDKCGPHRTQAIAAPRGSWIDNVDPAGDSAQLARPSQANYRGRRHGEAEELGQGVQPQPRNRLAPQRDRFRLGGADRRGAATAEQAPPGAGSRSGGGAPPAKRSAATPWLACAKRRSDTKWPRARRPAGRRSPSRTGGTTVRRSPSQGVAALCAAGPQGRRSRPLEAAGREGAVKRADAASSRGSAGAAALAAVAKRRPARCPMHCASLRSYNDPFAITSITSYIDPGRSWFEGALAGARP